MTSDNPDPTGAAAEFSRPFAVASLSREPQSVTAEATAEECAALARRFDLISLADVAVTAEIARWRGGVRVTGRVSAAAVQRSVVTLEPVPLSIDEPFDRGFLPDSVLFGAVKPGAEVEIPTDPELGDIPDPLGDSVDLGEIAAETIGLALDPYPREDSEDFGDHTAGPPGQAAMTEEDAKPFASLSEYREKLAAKNEKSS